MRPYPSYKDSEVEWIGEIPSHWGKKNLKFLFNIQKGKIPKKLFDEPNETSLPYLSMDVLRSGIVNEYCDKSDGVIVEENDLLILWDGSKSGEILLGIDGILSSTMSKIDLFDKNFDNRFAYYLLKFYEKDFQYNTVGMGIPHMDGNHLKFSKFLIPPLPEQTQIVSFLDSKTQKIDELIEKTEKKIELLKEKRTVLINHCVTKGLNGLDGNACVEQFDELIVIPVETKDSGIEWIGEIPKTWTISKLWLVVSNSDLGGNYSGSTQYDGIPLIKMGNMGRGKIVLDKLEFINKDEKYDENHLLKKGDFLFNTRNSKELVGKVTLWKDELKTSIYNSNILRINFNHTINNEYMSFLFNSNSYINCLRLLVKGTTSVSGIYYKDLSQLELLIPPIPEQQQIVEYLDERTQKIDSTIEKETQRIDLLKEYRQSLISEVVTGKIDVRGWNS